MSGIKMSFEEEVKNDVEKTSIMLKRLDNPDISKSEKEAINIFKRVLTVVDQGGLCVSNGKDVVSAANNKLPAPSYLAHGSRVLIQIPPTDSKDAKHEFINWLVQGDKSKQFTDKDGDQKDNPLFRRFISSHSTDLVSIEGKPCFVEQKGVTAGAIDAITAIGSSDDKAHHFGLNLAFNVDESGLDSKGKTVKEPDGKHGHMYMHYIAPSKGNPGSLMIGVENSEPGKAHHSILGTPNKSTHIGGSKWNEMTKKSMANDDLGGAIVAPSTLNGMRVDLDLDKLKDLTSNKLTFEDRCLVTPPKVEGNAVNSHLVNQNLDRKQKVKIDKIKTSFINKSLDANILSTAPAVVKDKNKTKGRG